MAIPNRRTVIVVIIGLLMGLGLLTWRMNMWTPFIGNVKGILVEGDKAAPPTRWWNQLYLVFWGWKTVTVFEVPGIAMERGYRVGYVPSKGVAMIESKVNHDRYFRMKNGHEDCTFFAVMPDHKEVPLVVVLRTNIEDTAIVPAPLH